MPSLNWIGKEAVVNHRSGARQRAFQTLLLPDGGTLLGVRPDRCFAFDQADYVPIYYHRGPFQFAKQYYRHVGDLPERGDEVECACFLDALPEVKFWVRNIDRRECHSCWLQTSTDRFYPDFVCQLHDGRHLVVE